MPATKKTDETPNIDDQFKTLEKLIHQLEHDTLPIEKALAYYEQSMGIIKQCQKDLNAIEQKVALYQNNELTPLSENQNKG